ncbi:uncharacterized protein LOC144282569 [Canis aureus]
MKRHLARNYTSIRQSCQLASAGGHTLVAVTMCILEKPFSSCSNRTPKGEFTDFTPSGGASERRAQKSPIKAAGGAFPFSRRQSVPKQFIPGALAVPTPPHPLTPRPYGPKHIAPPP